MSTVQLRSYRLSNLNPAQLVNLVNTRGGKPNIIDSVERQANNQFTMVIRVAPNPGQSSEQLDHEIVELAGAGGD